MSAAKHTPGPWRVFNHSWSDTSILADGFDHGICLLDINHATEESQEADEALMAANARLIAAAPELLDALKAAVSTIELEYGPNSCTAYRALITKAEGEAS